MITTVRGLGKILEGLGIIFDLFMPFHLVPNQVVDYPNINGRLQQ